MANKMTIKAIEKILREVDEPLSTSAIVGRLNDCNYKYTPSVRGVGQLLTRHKTFVKVEFNSQVKQCLWAIREETI